MDGEIVIGTRIDTDKFDKQMINLEKKMKKEEDKKIIIEAKLDTQTSDLEEARKRVDELADAYQQIQKIQDRMSQGKASLKDFGMYTDLQQQYGTVEQLEKSFEKAMNAQERLEEKVSQTSRKYKEISNNVEEYKQKIETIQLQKQASEVDKLKQNFNNVGNSIENAVKKASRLALGIFGIRSAYMLLRRASSDLTNYDKQYATNLEYIRWILTQTIAPVLRWIVSLVSTILQYIYAILNAWFGIGNKLNLSAKAFQKMKNGASGTSKAVKEIKKQLAGFDEINMLTDSGDTGTGGVGGEIVSPDFDLGQDIKIPEWLQWIIDNGELVKAIIAGITGAIIALKLGASGLMALGIGLALAGIVYTIEALLNYLKEPTWENFGKIIQGIGIAVIGLGIAFGGLPAIVAGVFLLILGTVVKNWDKIREKLQGGIEWLKGKSEWVKEHFGIVGQFIYDFFVRKLQELLNKIDWLFRTMKTIFDTIIEFLRLAFAGKWNEIFEKLRTKTIEIFGGLRTKIIEKFESIKTKINETFSTVVTTVTSKFDSLKENIKTKINSIKSFFTDLIRNVKEKFSTLGSTVGENIGEGFKSVVNRVLDSVESILNTPIKSINSMINSLNNLPRCKY